MPEPVQVDLPSGLRPYRKAVLAVAPALTALASVLGLVDLSNAVELAVSALTVGVVFRVPND